MTGRDAKEAQRILLCAFACNPEGTTGGEDVLGWNVVRHVAGAYETWVLTGGENRLAIEDRLRREPLPLVHFCYVDLPRWLQLMKRVPGGLQCYVYLWQLAIYRAARRLHATHPFHLFHHVTYANDWMASVIGACLAIPFLRGPGGGAQRVPASFLRVEYTLCGRVQERLRTVAQRAFRHDPLFIRGQERAAMLLLCNHQSLRAVPARWRHKARFFPVNGISAEDLSALNNASCSQAQETFHVLSAGKLIRLKGFTLLVKAFRRFAERYPKATLEIIGDGPDHRLLQRLIETLNVRHQVRLTPWLPRQQFLHALQSCDLFCFPSLRDGGGAVVIEAMAAGKPVVCFDLGGPGLHVTDQCGIKIMPGTSDQAVHDFAAALERLYRDPALRAAMGAAARQRIEDHYRWDHLGKQLIGLYQQILGRSMAEPVTASCQEGTLAISA